MSEHSNEHGALSAGLEALHRRGQRARLARVTRTVRPRAIEAGLWASLALPAFLALASLLSRVGGPSPRELEFVHVLLGTVLIAVVVAGTLMWLARQERIERADVLGEFDRELGGGGRLLAADDFLRTGATGPFVLASLQEGRAALDRAEQVELTRRVSPRAVRARALVAGLLGLALAWFMTTGVSPGLAGADLHGTTTDTVMAELPDREPVDEATLMADPAPEDPRPETDPRAKDGTHRAETANDVALVADHVKESKGRTKSGQSSAASNASGAGASRGTPSSQSQDSEDAQDKAKSGKQKRKDAAEEPSDDERKQDDEASGATAGRGSGSGSTKNPSTTDWSSKDHIESQEEEDEGEDAEVDDEDSDSEARGGVQPSMRDRRPPVNRDLQIGFAAGRPNPDANGRGGPSPQKKSRGVASLVLGVPIPDHIKGRANPGRTKVTQERVEPESEDAAPARANARGARESTIGTIPRPELAPWMRELVRTYFTRTPVAKTPVARENDR